MIENVLKSWVSNKILEYLGEEETTLIDFVVTKLKSRCSPKDLLEELEAVLDNDAETFVIRLWEILIVNILKH